MIFSENRFPLFRIMLWTAKGGAGMRMLVAFLVVLGVIYLWDANFNNGILTDGAKTMLRDIKNNIR
jgi:hypothetical protein